MVERVKKYTSVERNEDKEAKKVRPYQTVSFF